MFKVITASDVDSIYQVPLDYHREGLDRTVLRHFDLPDGDIDLGRWRTIVDKVAAPEGEVTIGVVGNWQPRGFIYLNAERLDVENAPVHRLSPERRADPTRSA